MDPVQQMPDNGSLTKNEYTKRDWLRYYKNVWTRNLISRCIDVETDKADKARNPEEIVADDVTGQPLPVKVRLEKRKMAVQECLDLLAGMEVLEKIPDEEFEAKVTSKEALAVAPDMMPKPEAAPVVPVVGMICEVNGTAGTYQVTVAATADKLEKLVCIPTGQTVEEYLKEQVEAAAKKEAENKQ